MGRACSIVQLEYWVDCGFQCRYLQNLKPDYRNSQKVLEYIFNNVHASGKKAFGKMTNAQSKKSASANADCLCTGTKLIVAQLACKFADC